MTGPGQRAGSQRARAGWAGPLLALALCGPWVCALAGEAGGGLAAALEAARGAMQAGDMRQARRQLLALLPGLGSGETRFGVLTDLALCALYLDRLGAARDRLEQAAVLLPGQPAALRAAWMHTRAQLALAEGQPAAALQGFSDAGAVALAAGDAEAAARAYGNAATVAGRAQTFAVAAERLRQAGAAVAAAPAAVSTDTLIGLAEGWRRVFEATQSRAALAEAHALLQRAARGARGDPLATGRVRGFLARLYEADGRPAEALGLSLEALRAAQQDGRAARLFPWQWQSARLAQTLGQEDRALQRYREAAQTLAPIRPALLRHALINGLSFREDIGAFYLQLADLLLRRAARTGDAALLREARSTLEGIKAAELEDYFRDDCVAGQLARARAIDELEPGTAVLYPVVLEDRVELLLGIGGELRRFSSPVPRARLSELVSALRYGLEKRTTRQYLPEAQALYALLVAPLEPSLEAAGVDTLVVVPDDVLRSVPLAALHDGTQFLIERYALATSPGLTLTDPRPLAAGQRRALVAAMTEARESFAPLPHAGEEARALTALLDATLLEDAAFSRQGLQQALSEQAYGIVHIASHGRIAPDIRQSFLLAHDGPLTLERLDELVASTGARDQPLELLTLSACQTAAGDERAALGLAGLAVKAGARSALASLWFINDAASAELMRHFYSALVEGGTSRAEALRQAQLTLLESGQYRHPAYWAPFLLIGSWL